MSSRGFIENQTHNLNMNGGVAPGINTSSQQSGYMLAVATARDLANKLPLVSIHCS